MSAAKKKSVLVWKGKFRFEAKTEKGLSINFDAPIEHGGNNTAPTPMETVLASLAACTSFDIVSILKKKRQEVSGFSVETEAKEMKEPPGVFIKIHIKYIVKGQNIEREAVERAIQLSHDKYCSVGAMLKKTAEITTSYEIMQE
jgi:putative redox protein